MKKIIVKIKDQDYTVSIGSGNLKDLPKFLINYGKYNKLLFIVDNKVLKIYQKEIAELFNNKRKNIFYYQFKASEENKSFTILENIHKFLLKNNFDRNSIIIAIGGGITGDLAGFAASTYMRGIKLIHVPTTLLACVDSSIGGKTGINLLNVKNTVGIFYQPKLVLIDINFLNTLPKKEILSGLGEVVKYSYLTSKKFYNYVNKNINNIINLKRGVVEEVIYQCILFKSSVVEQDEKEFQLRKILNLGHTFAHAIETSSGFSIKHGEAVIFGIVCAIFLSEKLGLIKTSDLVDLLQIPSKLYINKNILSLENWNIYKALKFDKKNKNEKNEFVLISGIGNILVDVEAAQADIFFSINKAKEFCRNKRSKETI